MAPACADRHELAVRGRLRLRLLEADARTPRADADDVRGAGTAAVRSRRHPRPPARPRRRRRAGVHAVELDGAAAAGARATGPRHERPDLVLAGGLGAVRRDRQGRCSPRHRCRHHARGRRATSGPRDRENRGARRASGSLRRASTASSSTRWQRATAGPTNRSAPPPRFLGSASGRSGTSPTTASSSPRRRSTTRRSRSLPATTDSSSTPRGSRSRPQVTPATRS